MAMYVVCHKEVRQIKEKGYRYVQAGSCGGHLEGMLHDDAGENISARNPSFCEMTAVYWIWKNTRDPWIGIAHYRRLFSNRWDDGEVLSTRDAKRLLQRYDVILPQTAHLRRSVQENYCANDGTGEDLRLLRAVLAETEPAYVETCDRYLQGRTTCYLNMMICRRPVFDEYCRWLFPILFEMEKRVDLTVREGNQKRIFGYLAELLLNVWVRKKGLSCGHVFIVETERKMGMPLRLVYRLARTLTYREEMIRGSVRPDARRHNAPEEQEILVYAAATSDDLPALPDYILPVEAGAALRRDHPALGGRDDAGTDHISEKNPGYCELTVLHSLWKNPAPAIKGLCHYRRYFTGSNRPRLFLTGFVRSRDLKKKAVTGEEIIRILKKADVILPMPYAPATETVRENLEKYVYPADIEKIGQVLLAGWPGYWACWNEVLQERHISYFNMLVAPAKTVDAYCEWLFAVLAELEERVDVSGYDAAHRRLFGYAAEVLLNVWVRKQELKIRYLNVDQVLEYSGKTVPEKAANRLYYGLQRMTRFAPVQFCYKKYCERRYPEIASFYEDALRGFFRRL